VYAWNRGNIGVDAGNQLYADYYQRLTGNEKLQLRDIATGSVYYLYATGSRITFTEHFKNLPEFSVADLHEDTLGEIIPPNQIIGSTVTRYTRYGTNVDVSQRLRNRSRASFSVQWAKGMLPTHAWTELLFTGTLSYAIAKGLSAYGGYELGGQRDEIPGAVRESHPRINAGIDYHRPLSLSRRTTLSFSTGTAGVHDRQLNTTTYSLIGGVHLSREFGHTWSAALVAARDVRYIEPLSQPLFSDAYSFLVSGTFTRRVDFHSSLSVAKGHIGTTNVTNTDSYYGSTALSFSLSRTLALGSDYSYSYLTTLPLGLPLNVYQNLSQQSFRIYVKVWAPLITSKKQP
jgi:hypothetical protein